jgi:hypothetical protein
MADYYTQFSCILDVGTAENAARAEIIHDELAAEPDSQEGESPGFAMDAGRESGTGALWIHSDEHGNPEHVIQFVLRYAAELQLGGLWGFTWSLSCSKPRLDAFGGGAHVLDLTTGATIADIDCSHFVCEHVAAIRDEPEMR